LGLKNKRVTYWFTVSYTLSGAEGSDTYAVLVPFRPVFWGFSVLCHECATTAKPLCYICKGPARSHL